ncbi:MAG: Secretion system C-terminal sorting domain [Bacteroidota bacterium]|jgi:hypothetical protein
MKVENEGSVWTGKEGSGSPDFPASDEDNTGCAQARALLFEELGIEFSINIWDDAPGLRSQEVKSKAKKNHILRLSPNPAAESTIISFRVEEGAEKIVLEVYDSSGRIILNENVTTSKGIYELPVKQFSSGSYVINLSFDNMIVDTITLLVQH